LIEFFLYYKVEQNII